jgi:ATP-binding cassette subfamily B protein
VKKLRDTWHRILEKRTDLAKRRQFSRTAGFLPLTFFELIVSLFLVFWVIVERITVGSFSLYLRTLRNAEQNLSGLVNSFVSIYENYVYVTDLIWFLNLEADVEKKDEKALPVPEKFDIALKDVYFRYQKNQDYILKGVSLKIEQGEKVALVGENGVGKTTLIRLIARFYDPTRGKLMINGESMSKYDILDWRKNISILFQDYSNYIYSAHESIGYGDVFRIDEKEEIEIAAKKAGIHEYIESLPLKYNTPLNPRFEKGVRPSTGQLQRIGIARTLFREHANVVILDEPTSNVDPKAEEKIFNELLSKTEDKIFIFVSQRFSTVRRADRILVMDEGKIVEDGTHEELMEKKGLYEELFTLQAKAYQ